MHAILATMGTDGDVVPFVGLGERLRARGHRVTLVANELFAQRDDDGAPALVVLGIKLFETRGNGAEFRLRPADIYTLFQTGDDAIVVVSAYGAGFVGPSKRDPNFAPTRKSKRFRHDADDGIVFAV